MLDSSARRKVVSRVTALVLKHHFNIGSIDYTIVLADDPVAADFTCARLMGLVPERTYHLAQAARFLGNGDTGRIDLLASQLPRQIQPFGVLPQFRHMQVQATKG